jgi:drug/metabolite transporter (DMT)-like permease
MARSTVAMKVLLFGALIAVVILKEPLRPARIVAALMIVCGLMLLRVA